MARGKAHSPELRAQVLAALMAGQGVSEVAKRFELAKSVVSGWAKTIGPDLFERVRTENGDRFGKLVEIYLEELIITLAVQQRMFRDPEWLSKQSASELGVLHGVSADKAFSLLAAAERASEQNNAA